MTSRRQAAELAAQEALPADLPNSWTSCCVGDVAELQPGYAFKSTWFQPTGIRLLRGTNIEPGRIRWTDVEHLAPAQADDFVSFQLRRGDIVIAMDRPLISTGLKIARLEAHDTPSLLLQRVGRLNPRKSVDPGFLYSYLQSSFFLQHIGAQATGTQLPHISGTDIETAPFALPPLDEQRRIVTKLDDLFARSRRAKEALDAIPPLLDKLRQSVLAAAFRGDLTADWRDKHPKIEPADKLLARIRVERRKKWEDVELAKLTAKGKAPKDDRWKEKYEEPEAVDASELPELPEGWCWVSAREVVVGIEAGASFKCDERPPVAGEIGVLKVSAVTWGVYDEQESKTCMDEARVDPALFVREGDFLFSRANTIDLVGACVIAERVSKTIMLSDKILRFNVLDGVGHWLKYALRTPFGRRQIASLSSGNQLSMRNIGQERIREILLPLPPAAERAEIMRLLDIAHRGMARLANEDQSGQKQLATLDRSILAKAFRGELVPQDPNDEPAEAMLARLRAAPPPDLPLRARKRKPPAPQTP